MVNTMPNMGNIDAVAKELNTNIFKPLAHKAFKAAKALQPRTGGPMQYTGGPNIKNFRTTKAGPKAPPKAIGPGKAVPTQQTLGGQFSQTASPFHPNFYNVRQGAVEQAGQGPKAIGMGQKQLPAASKGPIATPYQAPQRTFEMGSGKNPVPKNLQATQRGLFSAGPYKTFPKREAAEVVQPAQMGQIKGQGNLITAGGNISKTALPPARNSLQFADTSKKDNSPYPTHEHPAGSSSAILPRLSATETAKTGRPNTFTVGSRNIRGGGIAAMGSMLEQGLAQRPLTLPEPNKRT